MWKISIVLLALACSCYADKKNDESEDDGRYLGLSGFPGFSELLGISNFGSTKFPTMKPLFDMPKMKMPTPPNPDTIRNMTCDGTDTKCKGSFESKTSSVKIVNGKVVQDEQTSDAVQNKDGAVTEQHTKKN